MTLGEMIARAEREAEERWARNKAMGEAGLEELRRLMEEDEAEGSGMDPKDTIKRLPARVRARLERYRKDSAVLDPTSSDEYFVWYEHLAEIEGYIYALYDAGIVLKNGAHNLMVYCRNKEEDEDEQGI